MGISRKDADTFNVGERTRAYTLSTRPTQEAANGHEEVKLITQKSRHGDCQWQK